MVLLQAVDYEQVQKISASDRAESDALGISVCIDGDYAILGAYNESQDILGENTMISSGSAYIFYWNGHSWQEQAKLVASDRSAGDRFGNSVFIDGDYAVVGAPYCDLDPLPNTTDAGAAYVFKRNGENWVQEAKLIASDPESDDLFALDVCISGDYIVAGAYQEDEDVSGNNTKTSSGSAYIFKRNDLGWSQQRKLTANDRGEGDRFGISVSIDGEYVLVGAYTEWRDPTIPKAGAAFIFKRNEDIWTQQAKLFAANRESYDYFGWSVAIHGDRAVIGAINDDEDASEINGMTNSGAAHIFKRNGTSWDHEVKIVASDRYHSDEFGHSTAIFGNYVVIGTYKEDEDENGNNPKNNAGSAYIFKYNGTNWVQEKKIVSSDRKAEDRFANSVSISPPFCIAGAPYEDQDSLGLNTQSSAGSAYLFSLPGDEATPIKLSSFAIHEKNGYVNLIWRTESEVNTSHFILYRNNHVIAKIKADGNSTLPHDYSYLDRTVSPGRTYSYSLADVDYGGIISAHPALSLEMPVPKNLPAKDYELGQNYPNPFNPATSISYSLPAAGTVNLSIYDIMGEKITTLANTYSSAGKHTLLWDASGLKTGVYFYRLTAGDYVKTKKMVYIK